MLIGVMSDTHGRFPVAADAVAKLESLGAQFIVHCGDIGTGGIDALPAGRSAFVFGNTDTDPHGLARHAEACDVRCLGAGGTLDLDGVTIAVTHGDDSRVVRDLLDTPAVRFLFTGHTHVSHDRREGLVRWVNPGALFRATRKSVALVDLAEDRVTFVEVGEDGPGTARLSAR